MAGTGQRFIDAGYLDPKPLIKVNGKRIIEYILDMFNDNDEFIFICNDSHIKNTEMKQILESLKPNSKKTILSMENHKLGPVHTVMAALPYIEDDEEVIVSYCDNPHIWDRKNFDDFLNQKKPEGCIMTHTGIHPHSLNTTKMAFLKVENDRLLEIKEKSCYTDNHLKEHASTGVYYFRHGKYIKKYFPQMISENINYNGEYYVTLVYNLLIRDNLYVTYYDTPFVMVFGTPEEVKSFEAWQTLIKSGQLNSIEDAKHSYYYWKEYNRVIERIQK